MPDLIIKFEELREGPVLRLTSAITMANECFDKLVAIRKALDIGGIEHSGHGLVSRIGLLIERRDDALEIAKKKVIAAKNLDRQIPGLLQQIKDLSVAFEDALLWFSNVRPEPDGYQHFGVLIDMNEAAHKRKLAEWRKILEEVNA